MPLTLGAKLIIAVATTLASSALNYLLRPKPSSQPLQHPEISSAANGSPIPITYGRVRVAGQIIWAPGSTATQFEVGHD